MNPFTFEKTVTSHDPARVVELVNRHAPRLVHRIDRETCGLVMVAHDGGAAARLSDLFQRRRVVKSYRAAVLGDLTRILPKGQIDKSLDGKAALTEVTATRVSSDANSTVVDLILHTGRTHQLRRHLADFGFPVLGDPRYGRKNSHPDGLQLVAWALEWTCPFSAQEVRFTAPAELAPTALVTNH